MAIEMKYKMKPEPPLPPHRMEILIGEEEIRNRVAEISRDVRDQLGELDPIIVCVL